MQIDIDFFNASEFDARLKCTIQKTGKLGFNEVAINKLQLSDRKGIKIGRNKENQDEENLYMVIVDEISTDAFKINKAGKYYYVNTKTLFDKLGFDYRNINIMFDIVEIENGDRVVYKLIKREVSRKK
jgi:hypothetical protein